MEKSKQTQFEDWMAGDHVLVHLDSSADGVVVPDSIAGNPSLTLKLSYHFQGATEVEPEGIRATLKFSGVYQQCFLPWSAIWGMTSAAGEQKIWAEDLPRAVITQLARSRLEEVSNKVMGLFRKEKEPDPNEPKKKQKPSLKRIK